jgi:hypothetical protein
MKRDIFYNPGGANDAGPTVPTDQKARMNDRFSFWFAHV